METEEFRMELDLHNPDWFIDLASESELKTFTRNMIRNQHRYNEHIEKLRISVSHNLFVCARATHQFLLKNAEVKS